MKNYDLLNIGNVDRKEMIEESITEAKQVLRGVTTQLTCRIYSGAVTYSLRKRHILNRIVDTVDFECIYSHQFNMIPEQNGQYYLVDLTYDQFHSDRLPILKRKGYMLMDDEDFLEYLKITGYSDIDLSIEEAFTKETKILR